jgi:SAM-dependent methyltransferase
VFRLNVTSTDEILTVCWNNEQLYKRFQTYQRSSFIRSEVTADEDIHKAFNDLWEKELNLKIFDDLPRSPKILDIGSGIGVMNMLAYQYLDNNPEFHLLDKAELRMPPCYFGKEHTHYHSWEPVIDAIETSKFDKSKFKFIEPNDEWNDEYDLITSRGSWCWHYPFDVYWEKVRTHLKVGGRLYITMSPHALEDANIIAIISKEFGSMPRRTFIKIQNDGIVQTSNECIWIRTK